MDMSRDLPRAKQHSGAEFKDSPGLARLENFSEKRLQKPEVGRTKQKIDRGRQKKSVKIMFLGWLPVAGHSW
jgi:hypothetical protein